jgi:hypothetical protein
LGGTYLRLNPMDLARILQPQQSLEITLTRNSNVEGRVERISVPAMIHELDSGTIQLILKEEGRNWFSLFRPGRSITIQTGRSNGLFTFKSKVIRREIRDGCRVIVESPRILASRERRGGPRVPLIIPVVYRVLSYRERNLNHLSEKIGTGESQDLSKGGITLLTDLQLPVGLTLLVEMTLEGETVSLVGIVRRVQRLTRREYDYAVGIQFLEPGVEHQELIAKTIAKTGQRFQGGISL